MLHFALFVLLFASVAGLGQSSAQNPEQQAPAAVPAAAAPQPISDEVAEAEGAIAKSDWKAAETRLERWLANHPGDARALFDAGYVADEQNRLDVAAGLYRRAVEANPQSFEAHLELGLLLARQNKFSDARPVLAAASQLDPGVAGAGAKARVWRALAQIDQMDDPAQASEDLLEALKLSPETADDTMLAASLAEQAGQGDAAEAAYRRILATDPKSAPACSGLAHLMIARKQYPEAEIVLRGALTQSPDDPALNAQLATVLVAQDKTEAALPLLQKLHDAHPKDANINHMLAEVLAEAGDAAGSDKLYTGLLAATPDDPELLVKHGQDLIRQLKYDEAFAAFDKSTRLDPANADGWSGLAFAAMKTGQPSIALHALTMRSRYLPDVPPTYFLWASAYDALHDKAAAAAYYHRFLDASAGGFPMQEQQARQRLLVLEGKK
ncbi:MAG: tetratricopeptide repeat protein [Terracidiphilus sp.]